MRKYLNAYRLSTYLLLVFCAGHTIGGLFTPRSYGPEADAVLASMKSVHFPFNGADSTWYGFHLGFGLIVSVYLLLCAFITWYLGGLDAVERRPCLPIAWALSLSLALTAALSFRYFFPAPGVFASLAAVLLAIQCFREQAALHPAVARG
jgi:hypothetical protein